MDNLSEHKFDDLFREGSEKVEFEYREDAWAALDERLDEKERKRRLLWILLGLALSTIVIGSMFYYFNNPQNGASKNAPIQENVAITGLQKEVSTTTEIKGIVSPIVEENSNSLQVTDKATLKNTTTKTIKQQITNTDFTREISSENSQKQEQTSFVIPVSSEEKERSIPLKENSNKVVKQNIQTEAPSPDSPTQLTITEESAPITALALQEVENQEEVNIDEFSKITKLSKKPKSQFSFGAFGSLDYNSLSLGNDKIEQGFRVGLRTDYNFARRFSVGLGAAFSRKTYTAQGFRYNAKPGFWTDGIAPIEVSAICNVIEIPLELRFYAKGHNQDGFFAGAGINSYHIALEKYDFRYEEILDNTINNWEERGTNTNLLSVATLTFGYQKTVNNNLAIQIAPYLHLPFTGIGQGNVNLQSAGLNIAVNWRK
jgi:hypothetical protein